MKLTLKSTYLILMSMLSFSLTAISQDNNQQDTEELVKAERIAFFTEKIGLTPSEAEKFWPVYNAYWEKKNEIIASWKDKFNYYVEHSKELSDSKVEKMADDYIGFEIQKAELLKEYNEKFKEILPIHKVMRIYQADYEFKAYLLKKIKNSGSKKQQ